MQQDAFYNQGTQEDISLPDEGASFRNEDEIFEDVQPLENQELNFFKYYQDVT